MSQFYGAVKQITVTISSGATNQNASTLFGSNFTSNVPKILIINSGVELGATSLSNYALQVPSGMSGTLNIQNAGTLSGAGGDGSTSLSSAGDAGGTALYIASSNVTVTNTGTIRGGGGGGGRGADGVQGGCANPIGAIFCCSGPAGTGGAGGNGQGYDQSQSNGSGGSAAGTGSQDIIYVTPSLVQVVTTPLQLVVMAVMAVLMVIVAGGNTGAVMVLQVVMLVNIYNYQVLFIH